MKKKENANAVIMHNIEWRMKKSESAAAMILVLVLLIQKSEVDLFLDCCNQRARLDLV